MFTDGTSHTFPVHCGVKCFFKSCVSRVLQVVVVPTDCTVLKSCKDDHLSIFAKDGSVDWDKWTKTVAFAQNPTQFISELIKHGKSLGRKAMEAELKNVVPPTVNKTVVESNSIERPSDDPIAFLQGMTITKK